jgi:hypothetical protein
VRTVAAVLTKVALAVALVLAIVWAVAGFDLEPWVTSAALLAAVLGIFVEPWLATKELRRGLLRDLAHELFRNLHVVQDSKMKSSDGSFVVYPRVSTTVVEAALSSGLFSGGSDERLIKDLHAWHELAGEFNNRLDLTERQTIAASTEDRQSFQRKLVEGRTLESVRTQLASLTSHLMEHYADESGIDLDTVLFRGEKATIE